MKIAIIFCLIIVSSPSFANCETVATLIQETAEHEVGKLDGTIGGESWRQLGNRDLCRLTFDSDNLIYIEYVTRIEKVLSFDPNDTNASSCHRTSKMIMADYTSGVRGGDWYFYITDGVFEKFVFDGIRETFEIVWSDVDYSTLDWYCRGDVPVGELCVADVDVSGWGRSFYKYKYAMRSVDVNNLRDVWKGVLGRFGGGISLPADFIWWAKSRTTNYRVDAIKRLESCRYEGLFGYINQAGPESESRTATDKNESFGFEPKTISATDINRLVSQIRGCINMPPGAEENAATATVEFKVTIEGNVVEQPTVLMESDPVYTRALVRAIMRCGPYTTLAGETVQITGNAQD